MERNDGEGGEAGILRGSDGPARLTVSLAKSS